MDIIEQIKSCKMTKRYGFPGLEENKCAGFRTSDGEPFDECKCCTLQYQYDEDYLKDNTEYITLNYKPISFDKQKDLIEVTNLLSNALSESDYILIMSIYKGISERILKGSETNGNSRKIQ